MLNKGYGFGSKGGVACEDRKRPTWAKSPPYSSLFFFLILLYFV